MGWPPEKYEIALKNSLKALNRAKTYSEAQLKASWPVNEQEDIDKLEELSQEVTKLLVKFINNRY